MRIKELYKTHISNPVFNWQGIFWQVKKWKDLFVVSLNGNLYFIGFSGYLRLTRPSMCSAIYIMFHSILSCYIQSNGIYHVFHSNIWYKLGNNLGVLLIINSALALDHQVPRGKFYSGAVSYKMVPFKRIEGILHCSVANQMTIDMKW